MAEPSRTSWRLILFLFWAQVGVFSCTVLTMLVDALHEMIPTAILWQAGILFVLGACLFAMTVRASIDRRLKRFLLLTSGSSVALVLSFVLHNVMYALGTLAYQQTVVHALLAGLEAVFFLAAIFLFPVTFMVGVVGVILYFWRHRQRPHHPSSGGFTHAG